MLKSRDQGVMVVFRLRAFEAKVVGRGTILDNSKFKIRKREKRKKCKRANRRGLPTQSVGYRTRYAAPPWSLANTANSSAIPYFNP